MFPQKVKVAVSISGDYAAWHEAQIEMLWDFTNNKQLGEEQVNELLEIGHDGEYSDCQEMDAILFENKYYLHII